MKQKTRRKRTLAQKHGRLKWLEILLKRVITRLDQVSQRQRIMLKYFEEQFQFPTEYIEEIAAPRILEKEILQVLRQHSTGILPSQIAEQLKDLGINRWQVSRHIQAMNNRLQKELGKTVATKSGHKWVLSTFMLENWGEQIGQSTEEQLE